MANDNDNNPRDHNRRDYNRPEDNPFIAFRRFADSQVSSLLNTVFTLPTTIANYNNAHQAREKCLFGKADERQCAKLRDIEADIAELRNGGRELFRVGDVQAVLRNSEALMKLDRRADEIRREILGDATRSDEQQITRRDDAGLVERVANEKGQEWGWSWDWGFPRPFEHDSRDSSAASEEERARDWLQLEALLRMQAEARRLAEEFDDKAWDDPVADVAKFDNCKESHSDDSKPRVWTWSRSWQWPPPADAPQIDDAAYSPCALEQNREMSKAGVPWQAAYEDLLRAEQAESPHCMRGGERGAWGRRRIPRLQESSETLQEKSEPSRPSGMDADTSDNYWVHGKIPITQRQLEETMGRNEEPSCPRLTTCDEPSYEYSHDHEDQHDDPPTPKQDRFPYADNLRRDTYTTILDAAHERDDESETEMDAYERMDAASRSPVSAPGPTSVSPAIAERMSEAKPSILSTLTTTERTVASDGSITTKVVLKKRFADGREESSETVHTQRGHETGAQQRDPWRAFHDAQSVPAESNHKEAKKRSGWFWSS
ncbi:hypothetical protein G6011_03487 [Alternaria panax]|uniref:Uncharacterized protein n=1 Tax=Alternaria panax TaxID=48097 RepID=A0AAD4IES6_9PLEO|nr:hypothetical protein G6011_03487 [Alternaria panax]